MRISSAFSGVRAQIIFIYVVIIVMALLALNLFFSNVLEQFQLERHISGQLAEVDSYAITLADDFASLNVDSLYNFCRRKSLQSGVRILLLDEYGVVQVDGYSLLNGRRLLYPEVYDVLKGEQDRSYGYHRLTGEDGSSYWTAYCTSAIIKDQKRLGVVLISGTVQEIVDSVNGIRMRVWVFAGAVILLGVLISAFLAGYVTHPIVEMTRAAMQMSNGKFDYRVKVRRSRSEIARLAEAFNTMSEQLGSHERSRSEFISNVSHELKTPLSSMKILIEALILQESNDIMLQKEFLRDVNAEIDRLSAIISDLLSLMQMDQRDALIAREEVIMDALVKRAVFGLAPLAERGQIEVEADVEPDLIVAGNVSRLHQVVSNLIDNAIKYTTPGGHVMIDLFKDEGWAVLAVRDTGIGIPEKDIAHIFERFYRVDKARSRGTGGTGLGLAITQQIIKMHGGSISVQSVEGEGSEFTVRLPLANQ